MQSISPDGSQEEAHAQQHNFHLSPENLTSGILSRTSSNTSSLGNSPARPPKSERRQSSTSQEISQYTSALYTAPVKDASGVSGSTSPRPALSSSNRSSRISNLSMPTSPPLLSSIKAGSTPVSPNMNISNVIPSSRTDISSTRSPSLQRQGSTSTAELLASTLDSYHLEGSRDHTSASSSIYSDSVPPSPVGLRSISPPVAAFTAGQDHTLLPTLGAFKIESTTGSKATAIKPPKKKKSQYGLGKKSPHSGGISSDDIFGSTTDSTDDPASDAGSSRGGRYRAFSLSSRKGRKLDPNQSSEVEGDARLPSPTSPSSPSAGGVPRLSSMLSELRRRASRADSQASSASEGMRSVSRASSRRSLSNASLSPSMSEPDQEGQSHEKRRPRRLSKMMKGKTSSVSREEQEHLQILADLRLKALALASAADDGQDVASSSESRPGERHNAELLVRDMQRQRQRLSRRDTGSTMYSGEEEYANDDTVTSPISISHHQTDSWTRGATSLLPSSLLSSPSRPHADVPLDEDGSDEFSARKSFVDIGRRATLMPSSSHSSLNGSNEAQPGGGHAVHRRGSSSRSSVPSSYGDLEERRLLEAMLAEDTRRNTIVPGGPLLPDTRQAQDSSASSVRGGSARASRRTSREMRAGQGSEADVEDAEGALASSILERRRSTIRAEQVVPNSMRGPRAARNYSSHSRPGSRDGAKPGSSEGISPRGSSDNLYKAGASRSRNQSMSSSCSVKILAADMVAPPVRSSSRPDIAAVASAENDVYSSQAPHAHVSRHAREAADAYAAPVGLGKDSILPVEQVGLQDSDAIVGSSIGTPLGQAQPPKQGPLSNSGHHVLQNLGDAPVQRPKGTHYRRSSSDALSYLEQQRQRPFMGHHRRTSSNDSTNKALPARPLSERDLQPPPVQISEQQRHQNQFLNRLAATVKRNKPLPPAFFIKDELRSSRSSGERSVVYARKINELAQEESGLLAWLLFTRPSPAAVNGPARQARRTSGAPAAWSANSDSPTHVLRDDGASEAAFPLRKGSQDIYKARDITQRTPSVAPSTMVPHNLPYPGVYEDSSTLRTSSSLSQYVTMPSKSPHQSSTLASVALTAAGLPGKVGFFGLGRKSSKRAASRHKGTDGLSISSPIRPPSPSQAIGTSRSMPQRPSGPRPSISSLSSDREGTSTSYYTHNLPASGSIRSLSAIPQGTISHSSGLQEAKPPRFPLAYGAASLSDNDALTATAAVLPHVPQEVLVKYLSACNGDHLAAIGAYFEDDKLRATRE